MKWLVSFLIFFISSASFGQGFTYSYVDPCSKKTKSIYISGNENVTVNYLGYVSSFNRTDFQNGSFESWIQSIQIQAAGKPCDELKTQTQKNQNMVITQNLISTLTSITAASTMNIASSSSNALSNSIGNASNETSESPKSNKKDNGKNKTTTGNTTSIGGNQTSGQNSGSGTTNQPTSGNSTQSGGSSPNSSQSTQGGNQPSGSSVNNPSTNSTSQNNTQSGTNSPQTGSNNTQSGTNSGNIGQNNSNSGSNSPKNEPQTPQNEPKTNNSSQTPQNGGGTNTSSTTNGGQGQTQGQNGGGTNTSSTTNSGQGQPQGQKVPENNKQTESGTGGGISNSVANAAEATSGSGSGGSKSNTKVGSLIGTGDIVAIRSQEDGSNQFRGTMSVTKSNTNNTRAKGSLLNFTTTVNNTNLTLYAAFSNKKKTNTLIFANSSMVDGEWNFFNTTTALESKRFNKLSVMGGLNFTAGALYDEPFTNLSGVVGGFYPFKVSKNLSGNMLMLGVYSPFTKFYEGKWWSSGWLIVPFSSWDYSISKNFKYNVSFSGTYEFKGNFLQYQILTGGKILL